MDTEKIGMSEFRENLAGYLEGGRPLAITRHGETLGFFIPARKGSRKGKVEAHADSISFFVPETAIRPKMGPNAASFRGRASA